MTATPVEAPPVSQMCASGKHHRCLGTVYLPKPVKGRRIASCGCTEPGCDHGPR